MLKFRVYRKTPQTYVPPRAADGSLLYNDVAWDGVMYDTTGWFDKAAGLWKPIEPSLPMGTYLGTAIMMWQVWDQAGVYNAQGYGITAKLIGTSYLGANKNINGISQDMAAIGTIGAYPNTASNNLAMIVDVNNGDSWRVSNYAQEAPPVAPATVGTITIDSNPAHCAWACLFFRE